MPQTATDDSGVSSYFLKIALLGDGAVGKTSIRRRYMGQGFTGDHLMTIGADFAAHDAEIVHNDKDYKLTWQIWDLAGQDTFSSVRSMYYRGCFGGVLVFDRTRPTSFDSIDGWIGELKKHSGKGMVPLILLGNKYDLVESAEFVVPEDQIEAKVASLNEEYAKDNVSISYYNTSAKTGLNVGDAFDDLGHKILSYILK
ncbi:MAG: GTP-binding protein [Candidatus Heimdallarchaeota archaeon]|nr:GTP-binding protein [Candidatus Heimdallarchaeota archaeon]